jgi:hypothetical protein
MKHAIPLVFSLLIVPGLLSAGCMSASGPAPGATPAVTAVPAITIPASPSPAATAAPDAGPLRSPPSAQQVNLVLTKDRPTSELHLLYQGGGGDIFIQKIVMHVYSPDGSYQEYVMSSGQKPVPGDEIIATGTHDGDRCVVYLTTAGTTYKVIDEKVYANM